jgi:predicted ATPase
VLTAIGIGNFKAFAEPQRIPLRPLTLIFGANSSGKSSILHSQILARHAQETGELDVHRTHVGGESVDLGGFRQFIHRRDDALKLQLEWEIARQSFSKRLAELLPRTKVASIGITIGFSGLDKDLLANAGDLTPKQVVAAMIEQARENNDQIKIDKLEGVLATAEGQLTFEELGRLERRVRIESCWLDVDGNRFMSTSVRPAGHLQLDFFYVDNEAARFIVENLIIACSTSDHVDTAEIDSLATTVDELVPNISFQVERLFPGGLLTKDQLPSSVLGMSLVTVRKEFRMEDLKKVIQIGLPSILEEIITGVSSIVTEELSKLSYLGPLRTYPPRHVGFTQQQDPNWEAGGGVAWDVAKRDSEIRQKINDWLGNEKKLSTAYELRIRYLLTIESIRGKLAELASRATSEFFGPENTEEDVPEDPVYKLEQRISEIPDRLEKLESLFSDVQELILFDKRTKTAVSHRDVGIGISQALPVLVACFASKEKIVAMEQPEIHLHPALQAELGDVFIQSALGENKNRFLIETHSEHLLLRVMRRMRETGNGELPKGFPKITPNDVCVLFVEPDGARSIIREMPLNEQGELVKAWPGGFFEEGLREVF